MSANRKGILKPTQINAGINYRMPAGFFALNNVESDGMLDIVKGFDPVSAKPQTYEISARLEQDFAKQKSGTPLLAAAEADESPFLAGVRVDHAITIQVIKDDSQIAVAKNCLSNPILSQFPRLQPG